jgi:hypothetical protein
MIFNKEVQTEIYTSQVTYQKTKFKLCHGIIHKLDIVFPPGCLGLVFCAIYDNTHQVWPSNPDGYFRSDAEIISFREHLPFLTAPYELNVITFSVDDTYSHAIVVRVGVLPVQVLAPWLLSYDERVRAALGSE